MGGHLRPSLDASGKGRKACRALARELGHKEEVIWYWFTQITLAIEAESIHRPSRPTAEAWAVSILPGAFDKRGCAWPS